MTLIDQPYSRLTDDTPVVHFDRRFSEMSDERDTYITHWEELYANFSARKGRFYSTDKNYGGELNELYNNTPLKAMRTLQSGLMTGITNQKTQWFKLAPSNHNIDNTGDVRNWLSDLERLVVKILNGSNFYREANNLYLEVATIGTGAMLVQEDEDNVIHCTTYTGGEYYLDVNDKGEVNTFGREYAMTPLEMKDKFGEENISEVIQRMIENGQYNDDIIVRHLIEPVSTRHLEGEKFEELDDEFLWREVYYERAVNSKGISAEDDIIGHILEVNGYHEFPIVAVRWDKRPNEIYGRSPAMNALGDSIALQEKEIAMGRGIAKQIDPPTKAPSSLQGADVAMSAGSVNFVDDPNGVFGNIYQVQIKVDEMRLDIEKTENRIKEELFNDVFLAITQATQEKTATEVQELVQEKLVQLVPALQSFYTDFLNPFIDRITAIIFREAELGWNGQIEAMMLKPPPDALSGSALEVEHISSLAQAQEATQVTDIQKLLQLAGGIAEVTQGQGLGVLKPETMLRIGAEHLGIDYKMLKTDEELQAEMEAQQQQAQQAQAMEMAQMGADTAQKLGSVETPTGNMASDTLENMKQLAEQQGGQRLQQGAG